MQEVQFCALLAHQVLERHLWLRLLLLPWAENLFVYPLVALRMRLILEGTGEHTSEACRGVL